jgi:hypothetical protein
MTPKTGVDSFAQRGTMAGMEWISVKDRLPDNDTSVLAVWYDGEKIRVSELFFFDDSDPGETPRPRWAWELQRVPYSDVTHWMPLPEPPEVK